MYAKMKIWLIRVAPNKLFVIQHNFSSVTRFIFCIEGGYNCSSRHNEREQGADRE